MLTQLYLNEMSGSFFLTDQCQARLFVCENQLLCGSNISRQRNIFFGCKPHGRISNTV